MSEGTGPITPQGLRELFGYNLPSMTMDTVSSILFDATDDRTIGDVRAELRALAKSMKDAA